MERQRIQATPTLIPDSTAKCRISTQSRCRFSSAAETWRVKDSVVLLKGERCSSAGIRVVVGVVVVGVGVLVEYEAMQHWSTTAAAFIKDPSSAAANVGGNFGIYDMTYSMKNTAVKCSRQRY